ncbi:MAG: PAC2 family protein [Acidimicrobiales bacterium]
MDGTEQPDPHAVWSGDRPRLRRPVLVTAFEGWNDAGDAASIAAVHLADRWDARPVAEIDPEPFYDFGTTRPLVQLDDDGHRLLVWPTNQFRAGRLAATNRDVVVLVGLEPQLRWRAFCTSILAVARALDVERVITLGALLADVPHARPVEVYATTDDPSLMEELDLRPSSYEGPTGIVGVLSAAARSAGFPTASFWAAVPSYVPGSPSPKAALALVERVSAAVGTTVPTTDLEIAAATYERQVGELVAEDDDTAEYVAGLEEAWDAAATKGRLHADPGTLVAEVERFLRDNE